MVLSELLKAIQPIQIIGSTETEITGVNIGLPLGTSRTSVYGYDAEPKLTDMSIFPQP